MIEWVVQRWSGHRGKPVYIDTDWQQDFFEGCHTTAHKNSHPACYSYLRLVSRYKCNVYIYTHTAAYSSRPRPTTSMSMMRIGPLHGGSQKWMNTSFSIIYIHIYIIIYIYIYNHIYIIIYIEAAVRVSLFHPQKDEFRRRIAKTHSLKTNGAPKTNSPPEEEFRRQIPRRRIAPLRRIPLRRGTLKTNSPRKTNCRKGNSLS